MLSVAVLLPGTGVQAAPAHLSQILPPPPGYYNAGDTIDVGLRFNAPLVVTGAPRIRMLADSQIVYANYHSGSGTDQLTFRYTVQPGHNAPFLSLMLVELNGGTILGPGGEPADISIIDDGFLTIIDTAAPAAVSIRRHLPQVPNTTSGIVVFRVSFSEPVITPPAAAFQLVRSSGLAGGTVDSIRGSGTEWYVTIADLTGYGLLRLDVVANSFSDQAGNPVTAFSAGETFGRLAASLIAWGDNTFHQIDGAAATSHNAPVAPPTGAIGSQLVAVAATGRAHSLVLTREGNIFGWGNNTGGQFGNLSNLSSAVPVATTMTNVLAGQRVVTVAAGVNHSVALARSGLVFCWGVNSHGQLGTGDGANYNQPVVVADAGTPMAGKPIVAISAGHQHTLALAADGQIFAWGDNAFGQLGNGSSESRFDKPVAVDRTGVLAGKHIVAISAGDSHSLALSSDGKLYAWGDNAFFRLGAPGLALSRVPIEVVDQLLAESAIVEISVGSNHNLVRASNGKLLSWGSGQSGQLGFTTGLVYAAASAQVLMSGALAGKSIVGIGAGSSWSCALSADGSLFTWGNNSTGQLGKGTIDPGLDGVPANRIPGPVQTSGVLSHSAVIGVSGGSGAWHCLALTHPRANVTGMVAPSSGTYPAGAALMFHLSFSETVTVNGNPSLALDKGFGKIGYASYLSGSGSNLLTFRYLVQPGDYAPDGLLPYFTHPLGVVDRYGLGVDYALPPSADLSGVRLDGYLPIPLEISRSQPVAVTEEAAITTAGALMFRLTFDKPVTGVDPADFTLVTTGSAAGQVSQVLGTGDSRYLVVTGVTGAGAVRIDLKATGTGITDVLGNPLGGGFSNGQAYYRVAASALYGWGDNLVGQAGPNSIGGVSGVPAVIPATHALLGKAVVALASGAAHSIALCGDGTLAAWGGNTNGQLGCAHPDASSPLPVAVTMTGALHGKTVIAIAAGADHCLALTSDGLVFAWGRGDQGQLGTSAGADDRNEPTAVNVHGGLANEAVVAIAAGTHHSLALTASGRILAWGSDSEGQLGNGSFGASPTPVAVEMTGALAGQLVTAIAAGGNHSLALDSGGKVYAWGSNAEGQLGNDSTTNAHSPVGISLDNVIPNYHARAVAIAAGECHSVVLDLTGGLFTWGANDRRQLGDGSTNSRSRVPVAVDWSAFDPADAPLALASGNGHTLVRTGNGRLFGWGDNLLSQLGTGLSNPVAFPARINGGDLATANVAALAPGCRAGHSLVLVNAAGNPLTLIERWRLQYFGTPFATPDAADTADYDRDGRHNLLEYATATNPLNADPGSPALLSVSGIGRNSRLALTFSRILDPSLTYTVEASSSLVPGSWTSITPPTSPSIGPVTVADTGLMSAHPRRFLRLRVVRTP
jgi:alpha-tubulin suppressor-like RCC1 family protein